MAKAWAVAALACTVGAGAWTGCSGGGPVMAAQASDPVTASEHGGGFGQQLQSQAQLSNGRRIFRFDTFGDEAFWGGVLRLHEAIEGSAHGGVGAGVSPKTALAVGLKVDVDALDHRTLEALRHGKVNLDSPDTTLALLSEGAVVGVKGVPDGKGGLKSLGITCALCHSTVDDSFAPGIGHRLDGWPNQDLNVGAIVNLSPDLTPVAQLLGVDQPTVRTVLQSWGPGKFDAELFMDGKAFQDDGRSAATVIPPAYGLAGVNLHTYTGWGSIPYWNAFVAILEMHGQGNFFDPRLDDANKFPIAAKNGFGHVHVDDDLVTSKLADLQRYQLSLTAPRPPTGSFDVQAAAARARSLLRPGEVRYLPRAAALHRAWVEHAHRGGDRHRRLPGQPLARRPLPHHAAPRSGLPRQARLLPRRPLRHARRRGRPLRLVLPPGALARAEGRPRRVPEVAVAPTPDAPPGSPPGAATESLVLSSSKGPAPSLAKSPAWAGLSS